MAPFTFTFLRKVQQKRASADCMFGHQFDRSFHGHMLCRKLAEVVPTTLSAKEGFLELVRDRNPRPGTSAPHFSSITVSGACNTELLWSNMSNIWPYIRDSPVSILTSFKLKRPGRHALQLLAFTGGSRRS